MIYYYRVVDVLDLSTPVPCPHPGFCLLAKFLNRKTTWITSQNSWRYEDRVHINCSLTNLLIKFLDFYFNNTSSLSNYIHIILHSLFDCYRSTKQKNIKFYKTCSNKILFVGSKLTAHFAFSSYYIWTFAMCYLSWQQPLLRISIPHEHPAYIVNLLEIIKIPWNHFF